jgi:cell division septation protein DedD
MKTTNIFLIVILFSISLFVSACNSTGYEIEVVEDDSQPSNTAGNETRQPAGVQSDPGKENSTLDNSTKEENKNSETVLSKTYTIQIGAFTNEIHAKEFLAKAKSTVGYELNYSNIGGLYKIRTAVFNSIPEAVSALEKIKSSGYTDSFITETSK